MLNIGGCPPSGHKILEDLPEVDMGVFRGKKSHCSEKRNKKFGKASTGKRKSEEQKQCF